jgi:hypothetical protein
MEMSQGNSLSSSIKQAKMSFFFFYKFGEQVLQLGGGVSVPVGRTRWWGKAVGG